MALVFAMPGCQKQSPPPPQPTELKIKNPAEADPGTLPNDQLDIRPTGLIPRFQMVGSESGFQFHRFDDISRQHRIAEVNGGGVAVIDLDGDGREDLFMTNGCQLPLANDDRSTPGAIFRNLGRMQFRDISRESGLRQFGFASGCAVGDWDADGFDDLYVTAFGVNRFWRNNSDGTFSAIADEPEFTVPEWSTSAAFADINSDGWLDLYVVNYLVESDTTPTLCPNDSSPDRHVGCSPAIFDGVTDRLLVSKQTWAAADITQSSRLADFSGKGLGVVIVDLDDDRQPEIYVANDGQENHLFAIDHTAHATESTRVVLNESAMTANVALNETGYAQAGMGVTASDFDRNGTTDLFLTHFYGDTNTAYANRGQLAFQDVTRGSGLGSPSRSYLGFGTAFIDSDNNGWPDLVVANGHVDNREWMPGGQPWKMRPQFFRNDTGGSFTDVTDFCGEYFQRRWLGRGLAVADLDCDGRSDFIVSHQVDASKILHNQTETPHDFIELQLIGTRSNRSAVATCVVIGNAQPVLQQTIIGGGSFQSASSQRIHFGLGSLRHADLKITWPSGTVEAIPNVSPGRWIIVEGQGVAKSAVQ